MKNTIQPGRLDSLVEAMLEAGLRMHGNPGVRIAARMMKVPLSQALTETLGPGTAAGAMAQKVIAAADAFERNFLEAQRQIAAEDLET